MKSRVIIFSLLLPSLPLYSARRKSIVPRIPMPQRTTAPITAGQQFTKSAKQTKIAPEKTSPQVFPQTQLGEQPPPIPPVQAPQIPQQIHPIAPSPQPAQPPTIPPIPAAQAQGAPPITNTPPQPQTTLPAATPAYSLPPVPQQPPSTTQPIPQNLTLPPVQPLQPQISTAPLQVTTEQPLPPAIATPPTTPDKPVAKKSRHKKRMPIPKKKRFRPTKENNIYLNFENSDLKSFVDYIAEIKNINLIPDSKIAGVKIALSIRKPLSVNGAWNIFLTVLEMAGFSIIKVGKVYKIVPRASKLTEPLPTFINVPADTLPDSDLTIRFVTFLNNIPIEQARPLLQSMLSQPSQIIDYRSANGFVLTDKSYNIKSAMKVIQELDRSDVKQTVTVMKLKRANAEDVKQLFDSLIARPQPGNPLARLLGRKPDDTTEYFPSNIKIIAEPRTNSLILLGEQKSIKRIEDFIVQHVDTELKGVKSPIHIYELEHTDVDQVKNILEALVQQSNSDSPAAKYGGIRGGVKYFKQMKFDMDKTNNRLIVSCTDTQDWKLLKQTIKDLDKPQPQVAIETMIVSVDFNTVKELGSQLRNKKHNMIGKNIDFQSANLTGIIPEETSGDPTQIISLLGNLLSGISGGLGSTILSFGKATAENKNIWGVVKMLQSTTNTTVLSEPFIVTTNMKRSKIVVGTKKRLPYQKIISDQSTTGNIEGYKDADANLTLEVTPQINLDGVIKLDVSVNISDFLPTENTSGIPNTSTKSVSTEVSVANGQILVLGGFVKTKVIEEIHKTPLLNRIPVFGWLFKHKRRDIAKEYIFIFMSPTIIKPRQCPGTNLYTKMKLHRATNDINESINVKQINDPIHNWFFNPEGETYSHKVVDFANARYQPTSVDIENDPYYRTKTRRAERLEENNNDDGEVIVEETPEKYEIEQEQQSRKPSLQMAAREEVKRTPPQKKAPANKKFRHKTKKGEKPTSKKIQKPPAATEPKEPEPLAFEIGAPKPPPPQKQTAAKAPPEKVPSQPIDLDPRPQKREQLKKIFSTQLHPQIEASNHTDKETIRAAKRKKLKAMLSTHHAPVAHACSDNGREKLKDFLAISPQEIEPDNPQQSRREAFKNFIASNTPTEPYHKKAS